MKVKKLALTNYAGYKKAEFNFTYNDGSLLPIAMFYGPNGCGKSTGLNALNMIGNAAFFRSRSQMNKDGEKRHANDILFKKMIFHPDYDPSIPHFSNHEHHMSVEAVFDDEGSEKEVVISSDPNLSHDGIVKCEVPYRGVTKFIDADHPIHKNKFTLPSDHADKFLEMAEVVYGYRAALDKQVFTNSAWKESILERSSDGLESLMSVYQDIIIDKGDSRIRFKSMSDGEKKIATLLRHLCDPAFMLESEVILIDNVEMHVYFERHAKMIDQLISMFPDKQFIVTSHSGVMIEHVKNKYGEECLFNVPKIKGQEMIS